jgi:hypothetical protein
MMAATTTARGSLGVKMNERRSRTASIPSELHPRPSEISSAQMLKRCHNPHLPAAAALGMGNGITLKEVRGR